MIIITPNLPCQKMPRSIDSTIINYTRSNILFMNGFSIWGIICAVNFFEEFPLICYMILVSVSLNKTEMICSIFGMIILRNNIGRVFGDEMEYEEWKYSHLSFRLKKIIQTIKMFSYLITCFTIIPNMRDLTNMNFVSFLVCLVTHTLLYFFIGFALSLNTFYIIYLYYKNRRSPDFKISRNVSPPDDTCIICLEDNKEKEWGELHCKHKFHVECVTPWITTNNNCPICRQ